MIARALVGLALLVAGMLAVLDVGGAVAEIAGGVTIVAGLLTFDSAAFGMVDAGSRPDDRPQ